MKLRYLIIALGLLVVVVYGALLVVVTGVLRTGTSAKPGFTAKEAYPGALKAAQAWQGDAQLVSANASWRDLKAEELLEEEVSWGFTFFSPQTRSIRIFAVTPAGAQGVESIDVTPQTRVVDAGLWEVDSAEVLTLFLDHGGRDFLNQNPGATVSLRLGPGEGDEPLVWLAFGISGTDRSTLTVQVDPGNGEVKAEAP
ncbi:MAG: hypothetical protein CEE40_09290 [Chloroflexi bacterium B3_Chlor]|nr:MAG: hypothetical protein CEE40_09290 [Chloroflexi bacterium B3_Chlor]